MQPEHLSCRKTFILQKSSGTLSVYISTRLNGRWFSVVTRRVKFRHWSEYSRDCPWELVIYELKISASGKTIRMSANLCALMIPRTDSGLQIDGDLSDWKAFVDAELDERHAVILEKGLWTDAEKKIRAKIRYAWDDNYFYVAAELFKNTFHILYSSFIRFFHLRCRETTSRILMFLLPKLSNPTGKQM